VRDRKPFFAAIFRRGTIWGTRSMSAIASRGFAGIEHKKKPQATAQG
jgi:hypothetical protein